MAITYKETARKQEKWGIDVTVNFLDIDVDVTKTFNFDNEKQITDEFENRMQRAVLNIEYKMLQSKKADSEDIFNRLEEYFKTNISINKVDYEIIKNTEKSLELKP